MAKDKTAEGTDAAPQSEKGTMTDYFRAVFTEHPRWLRGRSNDKIVARWLKDHPDHTEMPTNVKNLLSNLKSSMRKGSRKRKKAAIAKSAAESTGRGAAVAKAPVKSLEQIEIQIDECLTLAKNIDRQGLDHVIKILRRARNEVVWKMGQ